MNRIQEIFDRYDDENYRYTCKPATEAQLQVFLQNCRAHGVPDAITKELAAYYKLNNNFFEYFTCDDSAIFEWLEDGCLWLGQTDLWSFRCLIHKHKYAIGDGGNDSFGEAYEFDTIEEMLHAFLSKERL